VGFRTACSRESPKKGKQPRGSSWSTEWQRQQVFNRLHANCGGLCVDRPQGTISTLQKTSSAAINTRTPAKNAANSRDSIRPSSALERLAFDISLLVNQTTLARRNSRKHSFHRAAKSIATIRENDVQPVLAPKPRVMIRLHKLTATTSKAFTCSSEKSKICCGLRCRFPSPHGGPVFAAPMPSPVTDVLSGSSMRTVNPPSQVVNRSGR